MTRTRGFTLLETLVALTILGLILAFYGGTLSLMLRSVARQDRTADTADDTATTASALRRLLAGLEPGGKPPIIEAGPHRLHFVTTLSGSDDPIDAVLARDGTGRLMLTWTKLQHVRPLAPPPRPTITEVAAGIDALDLSYFSAAGWTTALPPNQLPQLIRVHLVPHGAAPGPDLVVAPLRDAPL